LISNSMQESSSSSSSSSELQSTPGTKCCRSVDVVVSNSSSSLKVCMYVCMCTRSSLVLLIGCNDTASIRSLLVSTNGS
jgi:hypothetical protein